LLDFGFSGCNPDALGGGGGGGGGDGQVNITALTDCVFALFGVTLESFIPSAPGKNGSFKGFGADQRDNEGLNYDEVTVTNNVFKNQGTLTFDAKMSGAHVPPGKTVVGYTPPDSPSTNYTARDVDSWVLASTRIWAAVSNSPIVRR